MGMVKFVGKKILGQFNEKRLSFIGGPKFRCGIRQLQESRHPGQDEGRVRVMGGEEGAVWVVHEEHCRALQRAWQDDLTIESLKSLAPKWDDEVQESGEGQKMLLNSLPKTNDPMLELTEETCPTLGNTFNVVLDLDHAQVPAIHRVRPEKTNSWRGCHWHDTTHRRRWRCPGGCWLTPVWPFWTKNWARDPFTNEKNRELEANGALEPQGKGGDCLVRRERPPPGHLPRQVVRLRTLGPSAGAQA